MDINILRSLVTVISFLMFLGIVWWAWRGRRRSEFDEAQMLPFLEEAAKPGPAGARPSQPSSQRESIHE